MKKKTLYIITLLVMFVFSTLALAQPLNELRSKQSDKLKAEKRFWSLSGQSSLSQNRDAYTDGSYNHAVTGTAIISPEWSLSSQLSWSHKKSGKSINPYRYGLSDLTLSSSYKLNKWRDTSFSFLTTMSLPTSIVSQKSSLVASVGVGLSSATPINKWLRVSSSHYIYGYYYRYETSDVYGFQPNSPLGVSNTLSASVRLIESWSLTPHVGHYTYRTFYNATRTIQYLGVSTSYWLHPQMGVTASYSWKDRIVSNNSVFDDDTTVVSLGLAWSL